MSCLLQDTAEITEAFSSRVTWEEQHEVTKDIRNQYHVMRGGEPVKQNRLIFSTCVSTLNVIEFLSKSPAHS